MSSFRTPWIAMVRALAECEAAAMARDREAFEASVVVLRRRAAAAVLAEPDEDDAGRIAIALDLGNRAWQRYHDPVEAGWVSHVDGDLLSVVHDLQQLDDAEPVG